MESSKSEPNLDILKKNNPVYKSEDDLEENKENFAPSDDQFDEKNIK